VKYGNRFFSFPIPIALLVLVLSISSGPVVSKTIYDPFIQEFQVGIHSDPNQVELVWGYPAGLLTTASVDTTWTASALEILAQSPSSQSDHLCLRLLYAMGDHKEAESWTHWHRLRVEQLVSWSDSLVTSGRYLLAERLTMGFFRATDRGELTEARRIAKRLATEGDKLGLASRDVFIWELRSRLLGRILKKSSLSEKMFWDSMLKLGTFDIGNAWSLWTAHRKLNGYPALPHYLKTSQQARRLSVLRKSWLSHKDVQNSAFSHDIKAGLGARLLKKQDLNQHLAQYPNPPENFQLQGWWVSGQRSSRKGDTGYYESLGNRTDLKPGWQLDLFRRASEVHFLNQRWQPGLRDLEIALDKTSQDAGTAGQQRRLRQWTEQALVLALARNDTLLAQKIYTMASEKLTGDQKTVFLKETRNWRGEMGLEVNPSAASEDYKDKIRAEVEKGHSQSIEPKDGIVQKEFIQASGTPLWKLWAKWGLALVKPGGNKNLIGYRALLEEMSLADDPEIQNDLAIRAVSLLLKNKLEKESLLRWVLDKDIHHLSGGRSLTAMSPLSGLARKKLNDPAALHAMLGIALLADDLRGIVGIATPMAQTGLTKREKLCFLYPLPRNGSIHKALSLSGNDPALLLAVARSESLFEPSVRSRAGALGWMQIMPFHFPNKGARAGADNWSCAAVSIAKGDGLLTENRKRYNGNPYLTLAAYNAGPGAVARWQKQLGGNTRNDIFLAWIGYPETRLYVEKVLIDREIYNWIISESRLNY
jgi:hypothetical protein